MNIKVFFRNNGVPITGLTPIIYILKLDGTVIINGEAMTEVGVGFYYYYFAAYDDSIEYVYLADGTATLSGAERYAYGSNENKESISCLKILKNKAVSDTTANTLTIYDDDESTPIYEFDLQDENGAPSAIRPFRRIPK